MPDPGVAPAEGPPADESVAEPADVSDPESVAQGPTADAVELRREALTMALYVAVCLLAALTAVAERAGQSHVDVLAIVWGTTVGLALAHWFAFRLSARLVAAGRLARHDAAVAAAQLGGAAAVALLATIPVILQPASAELDVVRLCLAGFVTAVAFVVARSSGASMARSIVYAAFVLVLAITVAVVKNVLSGH